MSSSLNLELNPFERSFAEKPKISSSSSTSIASCLSMRQNTKPVLNPKLGNSDTHLPQNATGSSSTSLNQLANSSHANSAHSHSLSTNLSPVNNPPVITLSSNILTPGGSRRLPLPVSPNGVLNGSLSGLSFTPGGFLSGLVNGGNNHTPNSSNSNVNSSNNSNNNSNSGNTMNMNLNGIGSLSNLKTGFTPNESSVRTSSGLTPAWIAATSGSGSIFTPGLNSILGIPNSNSNSNGNGATNINTAVTTTGGTKNTITSDPAISSGGNIINRNPLGSVNDNSGATNLHKPVNDSIKMIPANNIIKSELPSVIPPSGIQNTNNINNKNDNSGSPLSTFFAHNGATTANGGTAVASPPIRSSLDQAKTKKRYMHDEKGSLNIKAKQRKIDPQQTDNNSSLQKLNMRSPASAADVASSKPKEEKLDSASSTSMNASSLTTTESTFSASKKDSPTDEKKSKIRQQGTLKKGRREMTEEEKRQSFLERNRLAASKCRQRKKQHIEKMKDDLTYYSSQYNYLSNEVANYSKAMATIKEMLVLKSDSLINSVGLEYFNRLLLLTTIPDSNNSETNNNNNNNPMPIGKIPHTMVLSQPGQASLNPSIVTSAVPGVTDANNAATAALLGSMLPTAGINSSGSNGIVNGTNNAPPSNSNTNGGMFPRML